MLESSFPPETLAVLGLLAAAVVLPALLHLGVWTPVILLAMLVPVALGYDRSLGPAARLMEARREDLIRTLRSVD